MNTLQKLESAIFDKTPLPELSDLLLWREVFEGHASPTQCALAIWFSESPRTMCDIVETLERKYPDHYIQSVMPYALAKAIVEEWSIVAYNLIVKLSDCRIPFYGIVEALITMPREAFIGRFDPRARMLPRMR